MLTSCPNVSNSASYLGEGCFTVSFTGGPPLTWPLFPNQQLYPDVNPLNVRFESGSHISDFAFIAQCVLTLSSVESNITCNGRSCGVTHIRRSLFDQRPPGYTPFSFGIAAPAFSGYWPTSANSIHHPDYSTATEYFLADPTLKELLTSVQSGGVNLVGMSADVFSQRFSLLLNTYWQCSLVPWYQTGNFPSNESLLNDTIDTSEGFFSNTTTATITNVTDVYICNKTWAMIPLVASTVLLLFGLYGAIVKHSIRGPEILGYVSTMTRDNSFIDLPSGGCALDGLERARLLKDLEVKLRDVIPHHGVGHIALSDTKPLNNDKFDYGRLYADSTYKGATHQERIYDARRTD